MQRTRQYSVFLVTIVLLFLLSLRLFYLQIISYHKFSDMASEQHNQIMKVEPRRGTIFDRYMEPLAIDLDKPSVFADARSVKDKEAAADALSKILEIDKDELLRKLSKDKAFVWLKRKIPSEEVRKIKMLKFEGIHLLSENERNYPNDSMAAHVIGFAGLDNMGLEGLELLYNDRLKGAPGFRHILRDARLKPILDDEKESVPPQNGYNLVLTLDSVVQCIAETEMTNMVKKFDVASASVIIMEPYTGKILAMTNYPTYNLNNFKEAPRNAMDNLCVSRVFEPGSVFKIVTASGALNEGTCKITDEFYCENGNYPIAGRILHDYHPYGKLLFKDVFVKSSNIGTVKIACMLGEKKVYDYVRRFGFGDKTGIDLPGEISGLCRAPAAWSKSDITTIPIGQGIAVTGVQLAAAISVIANGGYLVKPHIVDRITTWDGEIFHQTGPVVKRKVLEKAACDQMKEILAEVVKSGTGKSAFSKKYTICGKTGTAQMVNPGGGYYTDRYDSTFIGFAPKDKPVIAMVITAADPHHGHFGGTVAAPAFKTIAERVLEYLASNVPPKPAK